MSKTRGESGGKKRAAAVIIGAVLLVLLTIFLFQLADAPVLQPAGEIAEKQRNLLVFASILSLVVIVPVFILAFTIAWKYREGNTKATYKPNWAHSKRLEVIWWGIPILIIIVLAIVTWRSSHDLDPYRALEADNEPLQVQVVALQWRWLFIYPEQDIATINYVQFPENTPVEFTITADSPMNSFWIPKLGGQIYAMPGMSTKLHLIANQTGLYDGSSANLSGEGFAGMRFTAESTSRADFGAWVRSIHETGEHLDFATYELLAKPTTDTSVTYFSSRDEALYDTVIHKYMKQTETMGAGH